MVLPLKGYFSSSNEAKMSEISRFLFTQEERNTIIETIWQNGRVEYEEKYVQLEPEFWKQEPRFNQLVDVLGGLPRGLEILLKNSAKYLVSNHKIGDLSWKMIAEGYPFAFTSIVDLSEILKDLLAMHFTGNIVDRETRVGKYLLGELEALGTEFSQLTFSLF